MIMLCNLKYSRSLKLRPDHNRVAQWNSVENRLFIFFSPQCFMQDLIAYALWHLIDYFRQISSHHSKLCRNLVCGSVLISEIMNWVPWIGDSALSPMDWRYCKGHHWHKMKHHWVWEESPDGVVVHCHVISGSIFQGTNKISAWVEIQCCWSSLGQLWLGARKWCI